MKAGERLKPIMPRLLALFAAVLMLLSVFSLVSCSESEEDSEAKRLYESAVRYYNDGELGKAKQLFVDSGMYGDSQEYVKVIEGYENLYLEAVEALESRDYQRAYACFSGIPKYLNSGDYIKFIDSLREQYEIGKLLYSEQQFFPARTCFIAANGYEQSADYIGSIDEMTELYNRAMDLLNEGSYMDAITAFKAINTRFAESEEMIDLCKERLNTSTISLNGYIRNYNEGYYGENKIEAGNIEKDFSLVDSKGILFSGTVDENGMITRIAFGFKADVRAELGETGMTDALCHCILALNPYISSITAIREGMYAYLGRTGAGYGSMWVRSQDAGGVLVVEAVHYID